VCQGATGTIMFAFKRELSFPGTFACPHHRRVHVSCPTYGSLAGESYWGRGTCGSCEASHRAQWLCFNWQGCHVVEVDAVPVHSNGWQGCHVI
jgi:hypothetical protein